MIQKIRNQPTLKIEKLNTMIDFGISVQNLCATIQACELDEYYYNVTLLQELEDKLPPTIKLSWALTRKPLQKVKITDFNEWLKTIVEAACEITTPDLSAVCVGKTDKKKIQGFLNVHSEYSSEETFKTANPVCVVCHEDYDGSSSTLIEQELYNELGLEGSPQPLCLNWTGGTSRWERNSVKLTAEISSVHNPDKRFCLRDIHTVGELNLPEQSLSIENLAKKYKHLIGLPIRSYARVTPKILIGMNNCRLGHVLDSREGNEIEPSAAKTRLGWIVYGPCSSSSDSSLIKPVSHSSYHICECNKNNDDALHSAVKEYFALDSMGVISPRKILQSKEDERALYLLQQCTRLKNGKYESGLLWKYDDIRLPNSREMALSRTKCLEKRMTREPELAHLLRSKIIDYENSGYIRELTPQELTIPRPRVWYLPIFTVINPNKPGKLRIVWDAAAKVRGVSLNSQLLKGPDLLNSLVSVLFKFREYKIAITGDIREMFHQVKMNENDQHCQRFFWPTEKGEFREYIMTVLSFGATCSPSTTEYCMNLNAERFANKFPDAFEAITKQHYVDDMLASVERVEEAIDLARDVHYIHSQAGFEIRNWHSNSDYVLKKLGTVYSEEKSLNINADTSFEKILGMWWNTKTDCFTFKVSPRHDSDLLSGRKAPTKRETLRTLMTIFDPLGLIANFLMYLKVLIQEVWRSGLGWDDEISGILLHKWRLWLRVLPEVQQVSVPRCYRKCTSASDDTNMIELHTFVDASENGYAAVSYFRFHEGDNVECAIAGAKTRVAPLKLVTIPRLELQAAVLGARLAKTIAEQHKRTIVRRYFYTDSKDVMHWLNSDHRRYSQFVAARVSEILESTITCEWYWLSTKLNVADEGTKWQKLPDLSPNSRWFKGPDFMWTKTVNWSIHNNGFGSTTEELRPSIFHHTVSAPVISWERYSSWNRLLRAVAWAKRYVVNLHSKVRHKQLQYEPLSSEELQGAEACIYQLAQKEIYPEDYLFASPSFKLNAYERHVAKGQLYKLRPIMDERQVLRIPGRIDECKFVSETVKNPILLPRQHYITTLIVDEFHKRYHHQNHQTVLNELKQKFYIPRVRTLYTRIRRNCQLCKIRNAMPQPPMMSNLPAARLAVYARPFSFIGIDYFGPQQVVLGRRVEKRWGVLITCLTVRAIHIEIAHSLTTDSCIMAIRNFMSRRGIPLEIYSDRGTNFIGAERELKEALKTVDQDRMVKVFTTCSTRWVFNPPASPHMGGSWERLIQSVKKGLEQIKPQRTKWFLPVKPIQEGDIVIIVDPVLPRSCWPKGRVLSVSQSKDGQVRSAVVQTSVGVMERPAVKIAVLDIVAT
ncbi:uncharacterized protein LOC131433814 [Malaya genurostris]|uniref:uncharacterized protein LOC131433814 n=1 Tax=Malaya genurostris TaxID=325434 RepID=UPI0026F3E03D|nr:uncharacterized protein LOC131433814 [Malaya genurostris]